MVLSVKMERSKWLQTKQITAKQKHVEVEKYRCDCWKYLGKERIIKDD